MFGLFRRVQRFGALPAAVASEPARSRVWQVLLLVVLGLTVSAGSGWYLFQYAGAQQETYRVTVPARDLPPYTRIQPTDLETRVVPANGVEPNALVEVDRLVNAVTLAPLYRSEQVRRERVLPAGTVDIDRQLLAVNVDLVRSVGGSVTPGDLVDVWWVTDDAASATLAAPDVFLVALRDAQGTMLGSGPAKGGLVPDPNAGPGLPAVAVLAVMPDQVPSLVRGAAKGSQNLVLVRKFQPTLSELKNEGVDSVADTSQTAGRP